MSYPVRSILEAATGFQWDDGNATKNWAKHEVNQTECEQPFFNVPLLVVADGVHSMHEPRFLALGRTNAARYLMIVFTMRGSLIRVISARPMSRREREIYVKAEKDHAP